MKNRYFLLGDIHGRYQPVRDFQLDEDWTQSNKYLILLGDAGFNFYFDGRRDEELKQKMGKYPFTYFVVRGNHEQRPSLILAENYGKWHIETFWGNQVYVENDYPYIKYALDSGGEYNIEGKRVLVLPGAYSVDKEYRLMRGWTWFPQEQMSQQEKENIEYRLKSHYDYIFAHTCSFGMLPFISDLFISNLEQSKIDKSMERWIETIVQKTTYDRFYFGHYHADRDIDSYKATMLFKQGIELGDTLRRKNEKIFNSGEQV